MDRPSPPRRRRCFCGRLGWAITFVAMISVVLVGISAAAFQRMNSAALHEADSYIHHDPGNDNIVVVMHGQTLNLGEETLYDFQEQVQLLRVLIDHPEQGLEDWYLESWVRRKREQGEREHEGLEESTSEGTLPQRRQLQPSLASPKLLSLASKILPGKPQFPPIPTEIEPPISTGILPPLPSNIGGLPTSLPDQPELPTSTFSKLPQLPPIPSTIKGPVISGPPTAYPDPTDVDPVPTGTITLAPPEQPGRGRSAPVPPAHANKPPRDEFSDSQPPAVLGDTRPPIGKVPRPPFKGPAVPAPPNNPPGFKLPSFIQLPAKLIGILKRVVGRMATNAALPNEMRDVLRLVLHLLDRISKGPALPGPTSVSKILPTLTRPPIGKKPTLPPIPLPPGKGKLPVRPPPPGKGKLPHLPPGKGKLPRPPGKGKGRFEDEQAASEHPLSGFVEKTRRAADGDDDDDEITTVQSPAPTEGVPFAEEDGPVELLGKRPLTKKQRQYMMGEAAVLLHEEIERERDKNPDDPLNDIINVPTCVAVFGRIARHAEKWMGKQDPAERKAIEESIVEVGDEEDWDYGEGEWF